jgi:beta-N-acetylhexosaminidase
MNRRNPLPPQPSQSQPMTPSIFGMAGPSLSDAERELFRAANPAGYILFGRNIVDRAQLRALTDDLRSLSTRQSLPILIDQEGGRVARMKPPHWPEFPDGRTFDRLYDVAPATAIAAARANATAIALELAACGITVNCAPLLDVRQPGTTDAIGDRALGSEPLRVAALGRAILAGLADGGIIGVIKHMPGHGRALVDSHASLPRVDADAQALESDIAPFKTLSCAPHPVATMGMTAHILYSAWDAQNPATLSATIIARIIRDQIGFDGLLMSDDISMGALSGTGSGSVTDRATAGLAAGLDVILHCSADFAEMAALADHLPPMTAAAQGRMESAMTSIRQTSPAFAPAELTDALAEALARRDALLSLA